MRVLFLVNCFLAFFVASLLADETVASARQEWVQADALLNTQYARLLKTEPADSIADLRQKQRDWIASRDYYCQDQPRQNDEGDVPFEQAVSYWEAMTDQTRTRIAFLKAWANDKNLKSDWTGDYDDFFGGHLKIWKTKDGIRFELDVVRGPTRHTGEIEDTAKSDGDTAVFRSSDTPPAVIALKRGPLSRIVVTEENTDSYHGARAYFQGLYLKVANKPSTTGEWK